MEGAASGVDLRTCQGTAQHTRQAGRWAVARGRGGSSVEGEASTVRLHTRHNTRQVGVRQPGKAALWMMRVQAGGPFTFLGHGCCLVHPDSAPTLPSPL